VGSVARLASAACSRALSDLSDSTSSSTTPPAVFSSHGPTREYASCARFLTAATDTLSSDISPSGPTVNVIITAARSPLSFKLVSPVDSSTGSIGKFLTAV
jgi:hypothetical protein